MALHHRGSHFSADETANRRPGEHLPLLLRVEQQPDCSDEGSMQGMFQSGRIDFDMEFQDIMGVLEEDTSCPRILNYRKSIHLADLCRHP